MVTEHLRVPFQLVAGRARVVAHDSVDDITQCVTVLLHTRRGERLELLDYGIDPPAFTRSRDVSGILDAIARWEPRAEIDGIDVTISDDYQVDVNLRIGGAT